MPGPVEASDAGLSFLAGKYTMHQLSELTFLIHQVGIIPSVLSGLCVDS